ncbi:MAG: sodium-dependent transporter [Oscillospiraceae bacterium]|nr:sodium-dependent transporter [Oscillospiraceae bacterium]
MKRESFGSRLGFLLVSAGCAIGIGNVWRFPYITGQDGGGFFVLFYLICLFAMGVPVLTMELAVGRGSRKSAVLSYKELEKPGHKWHIHGWFCLIGCFLLMMYYTTVSGWMISYFGKFLTGEFHAGMDSDSVAGVFGTLLSSPGEMALWTEVVVVAGFAVCSFGLRKGLERISKFMMIALLALILILAVHSLTLPGASEGMKFYLLPSADSIREHGLGTIITDAMNQAFFTLSLGIAAIEIFGSYMSDEHTLTGEAVRICALDTFVALMAGTIIFPACFSFGVAPNQGPSLIFQTLPQVFVNMSGGRFWGTLFFLFMIFASFSTVLAVFENILAIAMDTFGISRKKAVIINFVLVALLSLPCVFGYNIWSDLHIIGARDVLDSEDFIVSNLLLPIGSLVYLLFCVSKWGWGFDKYIAEVNKGKGIKLSPKLKPYFQYVLPVLILIILIQGLV